MNLICKSKCIISISSKVYWGRKWVCLDASQYLRLKLNVTVFYQLQNPICYRFFSLLPQIWGNSGLYRWGAVKVVFLCSLLFKIIYPVFLWNAFYWHTSQYTSCFPWAHILKLKFKTSLFYKLWLRYPVLFISSEWFPGLKFQLLLGNSRIFWDNLGVTSGPFYCVSICVSCKHGFHFKIYCPCSKCHLKKYRHFITLETSDCTVQHSFTNFIKHLLSLSVNGREYWD